MQVSFTAQPVEQLDADTVTLGIHAEQGSKPRLPPGAPAELAQLIDSGEAQGSFKSLALGHAGGKRWLLVGLGPLAELTPERARVAAALVRGRARELGTRKLGWLVPQVTERAPATDGAAGRARGSAADFAAALVEGTILADYSFELFKSAPPEDKRDDAQAKHLKSLLIAGEGDLERAVAEAALVTEAVNGARDLQNRPGNDLTPTALAEHAISLAASNSHLSVEVEGREGLRGRSMGAFAAVAQGSAQEPALITLRYEPPQGVAQSAPVLGLVGKAVTFDSGGISLKPGAKMSEMKFDMSGGAAVLQATAAIARLELPLRVIAVVGATENLPSGSAVKPGDIVKAANGKTIEINNTDAEGRLVLADCLCHAVSLGAERIVDLATLTGAVLVALGSTHAGLVGNDDELAGQIAAAGQRSGEIVWRLPLHEEYEELVKGAYADLDNAPEGRKAGTIVGATFLANFVGDTPWAHLDIAGSAWDLGRAYAKKQASGYGVRLLVELARSLSA
ncbi:MAG TPA: leucyl aminopeptidase [Solirubrobacteraceae bacterium]|jgi:leucyl aminopeptidase